MERLKVAGLFWGTQLHALRAAVQALDFVEPFFVTRQELLEKRAAFTSFLEEAQILLVYSRGEEAWETLFPNWQKIRQQLKVGILTNNPAEWAYSTFPVAQQETLHRYFLYGGKKNLINMFRFLAHLGGREEITYEPPDPLPWQGIYHPEAPSVFPDLASYFSWYRHQSKYVIGLLFYRANWVQENLGVVEALIRELEKSGAAAVPVFSAGMTAVEAGGWDNARVIRHFFLTPDGHPLIHVLVDLQSFLLFAGAQRNVLAGLKAENVALLRQLNVPILKAIVVSGRTPAQWLKDDHGLGSSVAWAVGMPEFDGIIEPLVVGATERNYDPDTGITAERYVPIPDRVHHAARRILAWARLKRTPPQERKVTFVLHNNPCAGVEAAVGGGARLDTLESVARLLQEMARRGYDVGQPPRNGRELIDLIMTRKAVSEFRWTSVQEIVEKGGAYALLEAETYSRWFAELPAPVQERIKSAWGEPPGQAMVYQNKIVLTGIAFGKTMIMVQPKRGCAGARCDGTVCKILHDPAVPPTHQYLASYWFQERVRGTHVIIHVGTHGNLEFLPGKSVGLSGEDYPDLALGALPHLYLYVVDNPAEGTIAKRRSYATLIDHNVPALAQAGNYGHLDTLSRYLDEYSQLDEGDTARREALAHLIQEEIREANLTGEVPLEQETMEEVVKRAHEVITRTRDSLTNLGLHIFGETPTGTELVETVTSFLRLDRGQKKGLPHLFFSAWGLNYAEALAHPGEKPPGRKTSYSTLLDEAHTAARHLVAQVLAHPEAAEDENALAELATTASLPPASLAQIVPAILDVAQRILLSRQEIDSFFTGLDGGYIEAGPSGLPSRGALEVLPTGRNFYSLDPRQIPSPAAWEVGKKLADALLERYLAESGHWPENVGLIWFASDVMWTQGEQLAQMFYLLGVRPLWDEDGRVTGVSPLSLAELGRPRIDVTVRFSGIIRDTFPNLVQLFDQAVQLVARLEEREDDNFIRRHALQQEPQGPASPRWRLATARLFSARPGTYGNGVNLAVYASAWRREQDLAEVFLQHDSFAYGDGLDGRPLVRALLEQLKTVTLTYKNNGSDEHDLLGCCAHFGQYGGLTAAARVLSGQEVRTYHGDSRNPAHPRVVSLSAEINRVVRTRLLNPKWIEGMKAHGYKGAGDIAKRVGRVFGWGATTGAVEQWVFTDITQTFVLNEENRRFFEESNPWALEEIARRMLEAAERGIWKPDPETLAALKEAYLDLEGMMEESQPVENVQGGSIDIYAADDVADWDRALREIREELVQLASKNVQKEEVK